MQDRRDDEVLQGLIGNSPDDLFNDIPMPTEATHRVIGKQPQKGDRIKVDGREYKVIYVKETQGEFSAQAIDLIMDLPKINDEFEVNGLKFKVTYVSTERARFTAQLMGLKPAG